MKCSFSLINKPIHSQDPESCHLHHSDHLAFPKKSMSLQNHSERKFNLLFLGIPESLPSTSFSERLDNDYSAVLSAIGSTDVTHSFVHDCIHLGKYQRSNQRPRLLLVKFNKINVINSVILSSYRNKSSSGNHIVIKQDLSIQKRQDNAILLKERYWLISDKNIDKHLIKIKRNKIFINNRPHGEVRSNNFVPFPSLGDLTPSLPNVTTNNTSDDSPTVSQLTSHTSEQASPPTASSSHV